MEDWFQPSVQKICQYSDHTFLWDNWCTIIWQFRLNKLAWLKSQRLYQEPWCYNIVTTKFTKSQIKLAKLKQNIYEKANSLKGDIINLR